MLIGLVLIGKTINLTSDNININSTNFKVDKNGNMECNNASINGGKLLLQDSGKNTLAQFRIQNKENENNFLTIFSDQIRSVDQYGEIYITPQVIDISNNVESVHMNSDGLLGVTNDGYFTFYTDAKDGITFAETLKYKNISQFSLESLKKNIEKCNINAIDIINNSEIYTYNYKEENVLDKKHIGFVIGEKYKVPIEVISKTEDGIDIYSMASILWKAIQEQQETIENLLKRIERLEEKNGIN